MVFAGTKRENEDKELIGSNHAQPNAELLVPGQEGTIPLGVVLTLDTGTDIPYIILKAVL